VVACDGEMRQRGAATSGGEDGVDDGLKWRYGFSLNIVLGF
jgi:hypothetical protein